MGIVRQSALMVAAALVGCAGSAFEQERSTGSDLAGAAGAADAGSIGTGGSSMPAGAGPALTAGSGGDPVTALGGAAGEPAGAGAGGELEPAATTACDRSGWHPTAFASREDTTSPAKAIDGDEQSRWTSGQGRAVGQWLELELNPAQRIAQLELRAPAGDLPTSLVVKLNDRETAAMVTTSTAGALVVRFKPQTVTTVRLELDQASLAWWSVSELVGLCER